MEMSQQTDALIEQLEHVANVGGDDLGAAMKRVGPLFRPLLKLALLDAVTTATAEISESLTFERVSARLAPEGVKFDVTPKQSDATPVPESAAETDPGLDEGDISRVSLRLPEGLKARAEKRAEASGQSLNAWLVQVIRDAVVEPRTSPFTKHWGFTPDNPPKGTNPVKGWI
ncbi:MAG: Arc family DNA-binding protein [Dermabacter sp.]|nr:Arc family DNA-binding protein [Dermabacter sp.]